MTRCAVRINLNWHTAKYAVFTGLYLAKPVNRVRVCGDEMCCEDKFKLAYG